VFSLASDPRLYSEGLGDERIGIGSSEVAGELEYNEVQQREYSVVEGEWTESSAEDCEFL
jgi:hypothetical protein